MVASARAFMVSASVAAESACVAGRKPTPAASSRINPEVLAALSGKSDYQAVTAKASELGVPSHVRYDQPTVVLAPVYGGPDASAEDKAFWEASPNGRLEMTITNPDAAETFELGANYYLTFEPAGD